MKNILPIWSHMMSWTDGPKQASAKGGLDLKIMKKLIKTTPSKLKFQQG